MKEKEQQYDAASAPSASGVQEPAWSRGGLCSDTKIALSLDDRDDYLELEYITAGCSVLSRCEATGRTEARLVLKTYETTRDRYFVAFAHPDISGRKWGLWTTLDQLLWVEQAGWTRVGDLRPGQVLRVDDEAHAVVEVSGPTGPFFTRGLVVDGFHTYYARGMWVHDGYHPDDSDTRSDCATGTLFAKNASADPDLRAVSLTDARRLLNIAKCFWRPYAEHDWCGADADATLMDDIEVDVRPLEGTALASIDGNVITLSPNAAGWGWYIEYNMWRCVGGDAHGPQPERYNSWHGSSAPFYAGDPAGTKIDLLVTLMLQLREVVTRRHA